MDPVKVYQILEKQGFPKEDARSLVHELVNQEDFSHMGERFDRVENSMRTLEGSIASVKKDLESSIASVKKDLESSIASVRGDLADLKQSGLETKHELKDLSKSFADLKQSDLATKQELKELSKSTKQEFKDLSKSFNELPWKIFGGFAVIASIFKLADVFWKH